MMHVDLDYVFDNNAQQQQRNADLLVQRVKDMAVNTVFLQAFADPLGDGLVRSVYFPNRWLPMRTNLFGPLARRLRTEARVQVYAWMPVLSFDLDADFPRITEWSPQQAHETATPARNAYVRLSPFDARVQRAIGEIYEDLATHTEFDGLLFHDDALMSDFEDAGPHALASYRRYGLPESIEQIRDDPALMHRWTRLKSETLNEFTLFLRDRVREIRGPQVKTARNLFARPLLEPHSETWFAQNLDDFLALYDWTAPMAMPLMEGVPEADAAAWLETLVDTVSARPGALCRTVFELQSRDWSKPGQPAIDSALLVSWIQTMMHRGARSVGYYPDDFYRNAPDASLLAPVISERNQAMQPP